MKRELRYSDAAQDHLQLLRKRDQQIVFDAIDDNLIHEADEATRNRKKLEKNKLAAWELRVGAFEYSMT